MVTALRTQILDILPCPKCRDPMGPHPQKGSKFPKYLCGNALCRYEGDGTRASVLPVGEQLPSAKKQHNILANPERRSELKRAQCSFFIPTGYWIGSVDELTEVTYFIVYREYGSPENPETWRVNLSFIEGLDVEMLKDKIFSVNQRRPSGWKNKFAKFLSKQIEEVFSAVPVGQLLSLRTVTRAVVLKD